MAVTAGIEEVDVDNGTGVNVGVPADGADVAVLAGDIVGALVVSCACTVNAAAVRTASGFGWFGVLDGILQASIALMMTATARIT